MTKFRITNISVVKEREYTMVINYEGQRPQPETYEAKGQFFFAEKEGFVRFFSYRGPGDGYCGDTFTVKLIDGTTMEIEGPWSSRCSVMNDMGFTRSMEVTLYDSESTYRSAVTVEFARKLLKEFNLPYVIVRDHKSIEIKYIIVPIKEVITPKCLKAEEIEEAIIQYLIDKYGEDKEKLETSSYYFREWRKEWLTTQLLEIKWE